MCAKRRERGDGSIYQRASDGMYVAYARLNNGKKKYIYDKTKTGVAKKLRILQRQIEQNTLVTAKSETVETYLHYWLDIRYEQKAIAESTYRSYQRRMKIVCSYIGAIKLTKLTGDKLQMMYSKLQSERKHKPSTVKLIHRILNTAFKQAIRWKKMNSNPCQDADAPSNKDEKHEGIVLAPQQALDLLALARSTDIEMFLTLALGTGMRRGELLGLRWAMIDLESKQLRINKTASYIPDDAGHYKTVERAGKTKASRRAIALPQFVVDALKVHKVRQLEQRLQAGAKWKSLDLVFCTPTGDFYNVATLRNHFNVLLQQCNLPHMRIHDLRHSAATLLLYMGVPMKVVQEILGHSSITITMDLYGHLLPGMQEDAMNKMDDLFGEKNKKERREGTKE